MQENGTDVIAVGNEYITPSAKRYPPIVIRPETMVIGTVHLVMIL